MLIVHFRFLLYRSFLLKEQFPALGVLGSFEVDESHSSNYLFAAYKSLDQCCI